MSSFSVIMLGMARSIDWRRGISNRQLEVAEELRGRSEVSCLLAVDALPWRCRDLVKFGLDLRRGGGAEVRRYRKPWRRLWRDGRGASLATLSSVGWGGGRRAARDIAEAAAELGLASPVVWSYLPTAAGVAAAEFLDRRLLVFDAVDNWIEHPTYRGRRAELERGYRRIGELADLIFTVNPSNVQLFPARSDVRHVPNGVRIERFSAAPPMPEDVRRMPRPLLGYVGTIERRLDVEILRRLSVDFSGGSIALVGPVWHGSLRRQLAQLPNVTLLGRKSYAEVPGYLASFDVCLVPHRRDRFVASTEAMKVYEYLAAGRPIVTTSADEFSALGSLLYVGRNPGEFSAMVTRALAEDSPQLAHSRRAAAASCSWAARVDLMLQAIQAKL